MAEIVDYVVHGRVLTVYERFPYTDGKTFMGETMYDFNKNVIENVDNTGHCHYNCRHGNSYKSGNKVVVLVEVYKKFQSESTHICTNCFGELGRMMEYYDIVDVRVFGDTLRYLKDEECYKERILKERNQHVQKVWLASVIGVDVCRVVVRWYCRCIFNIKKFEGKK